GVGWMTTERREGQRLHDLAIGGGIDVPFVKGVLRRPYAEGQRRNRRCRGRGEQRGDGRQRTFRGPAAQGTEAVAILTPELPAERVDEKQHDLLRLAVAAAETVRGQQGATLGAGEQVLDGIGNIAEAVIGIDRPHLVSSQRLQSRQRSLV